MKSASKGGSWIYHIQVIQAEQENETLVNLWYYLEGRSDHDKGNTSKTHLQGQKTISLDLFFGHLSEEMTNRS